MARKHPLQYLDDGSYHPGFWGWLLDNPHVYEEFKRLALMTKRRGVRRWAARAILHVLRWQTAVRDRTDRVFKINNNWSAGLARLTMATTPELKDFFVTRETSPQE